MSELVASQAIATEDRISAMEQRLEAKVEHAQLALDAIMLKLGTKVSRAADFVLCFLPVLQMEVHDMLASNLNTDQEWYLNCQV